MVRLRGLAVLGLMCVVAGLALPAAAAIPNTVLIEGVLQATGGGAAADGDYAMTFTLVTAGQNPTTWKEGPVTIAVKNAAFVHALGSVTPLDASILDKPDAVSLQIQIGEDPALPKQPLNASLFALRAALSQGLSCSGCVTAAQLGASVIDDLIAAGKLAKVAKTGAFADLSGGPDLSGYAQLSKLAKVATSGAYADLLGLPDLTVYAKAVSLATVATSGSYKDLEDLPVLAKLDASCGTGLVIQGLKANGEYECVAAMDPSALPGDGLDEISGGLLTNQFDEAAASAKTPLEIPDNNPVGISDLIDLPDFGLAQSLTVSAEVTNSDTANLVLNLVDPAGTKYVLWSKTAKGTTVKTTWPTLTKTVSGDLGAWVGKNPKGKWYLQVIDTAFLNNAKDGALKAWSIQVKVQSSVKVGMAGALVLQNVAQEPFPCGTSVQGALYFDSTDKAVRYCDGSIWRKMNDTCGNGNLDTGEQCDDGNQTNGDGCSSTCVAATGYAEAKPGSSCANVLTLAKADGGSPKTGLYWVDPDGAGALAARQVGCDMTTDGGGWTVVWASADTDPGDVPWTTGSYGTNPFIEKSKVTLAYLQALQQTEHLLVRKSGAGWLKVNKPFFASSQWPGHNHYSATITSASGQTAAATLAFSNTGIGGGGWYALANGAPDHHAPGSYMDLNGGCTNDYVYVYGGNYFASNTALGSGWPASNQCSNSAADNPGTWVGVR